MNIEIIGDLQGKTIQGIIEGAIEKLDPCKSYRINFVVTDESKTGNDATGWASAAVTPEECEMLLGEVVPFIPPGAIVKRVHDMGEPTDEMKYLDGDHYGFDEKRMDVIGQNGPTGEHYVDAGMQPFVGDV